MQYQQEEETKQNQDLLKCTQSFQHGLPDHHHKTTFCLFISTSSCRDGHPIFRNIHGKGMNEYLD